MVHAGVIATWGPRAPAIKARIGIDDGGFAVALAALTIAMFVGARSASALMHRFGPRPIIRVAVVVLATSLLGPAVAPTLLTLAVGLAAMGATMGVLDVAMNAESVDVEQRAGRPVLIGLHGTWSLGMLVAGGIAALAAAAGMSTLVHFGVMAAVFVGVALVAGPRLPRVPRAEPVDEPRGRGFRVGAVVLLGLVAACGFASEGAAADWSAVYLHDHLAATQGVAALGFVAFAVGMTAARLLGDRVLAGVEPRLVLVVAGGAGAFGMALVIAGPWVGPAIIGFLLMGIAFAPIVPIVFRSAGSGPAGHRRLGWVVTVGYLGTMAGPVIIGVLAARWSLRVGLALVIALGLLIATLSGPALVRATRR